MSSHLNAGVIALVPSLAVDDETLHFYWPLALLAVLLVSVPVRVRSVPRAAGVLLVALCVVVFIAGSF